MKKIIFGVFAHPDDEAFGPAGTLLKETKTGSEIHIITLTPGQNGTNPDNVSDLGAVRLREWKEAAHRMGVEHLHQLDYEDGYLCNQHMISAAEAIEQIVSDTLDAEDDYRAEFLCFDKNGISGHIDHIVATRAALLAYYRLKPRYSALDKVRLFALPRTHIPEVNTDWLYMEAGRDENEFDEIIDARDLADEIRHVMAAHHSQRNDARALQTRYGEALFINHFIVIR